MKRKKSLKSENTLKSSDQSISAIQNQSTPSDITVSNSKNSNKSQAYNASSASIVSNQTIDTMINSLKKYNQKINFTSYSTQNRIKSSATNKTSHSTSSQTKSRSFNSLKQSVSNNKIHFTNSKSSASIQDSKMDSLADLLFDNILLTSSSNSTSASLPIHHNKSMKSSINSTSNKIISLTNNHANEISSTTNSDILSEFNSAENSLNHSYTDKKQTKTANVAKSTTSNGINTPLNSINKDNRNIHHHRVIKHVKGQPSQGLHEYQRSISKHYSRHIILVLIIVTICCSFAGIIGYAATLV